MQSPRRLASDLRLEIVVHQRGRERNHGAIDAEPVHARDLPRRLEEGRVQAEVHAAHRDVDALAVHRRHAGVELLARLHELEQLVRNEMTVDIGDHFTAPNMRPSTARPREVRRPRPA